MGWQTVAVPILLAGNTIINDDGAFVYDGSPAAGNLIGSVSGTATEDPYGDQLINEVASYSAPNAAAMAGGAFSLYTGSESGGWSLVATMEISGGGIQITSTGTITLACTGTQLNNSAVVEIPAGGLVSGFPLPADSNSGSTWVSGERAFMNNNWITPINSLYTALVDAGIL